MPIPVVEGASLSTSTPTSGTGSVTTGAATNGRSIATTVATRSIAWRDWMASLHLGGRTLAMLVGFCLLAGLVAGWLARAEDLLSNRAEVRPVLPALWMAPQWGEIARQESAEDQYHYAQLRASRADQEAAWIAVPGYFPDSRAWASQAYIQLARILLRRHDAERLRVFATEIERWNAATQAREHENELVTIVQAATKALDGDQEGVIKELNKLDLRSTIDAALLELAVEVTVQATRSASRTGTLPATPPGLRTIQGKLLGQLSTVEINEQLRRRRSG
jgi:serine/threonine-protein kinase